MAERVVGNALIGEDAGSVDKLMHSELTRSKLGKTLNRAEGSRECQHIGASEERHGGMLRG